MINYELAKIYKLVNNTTKLTYYGATCSDLSKRKYFHKHKSNTTRSKLLFNLHPDDVEIILVESYPCSNKDELKMRERYYIENNDCVNRKLPYVPSTKVETELEWKRVFYKDNKEIISLKQKDYYVKNSENIKARVAKYYAKNRDKILIRNREVGKHKVTCPCGSIVTKQNFSHHKQTVKHKRFLSNK